MPGLINKGLEQRMYKPSDYHRIYEVRAAEAGKPEEMVLEGRAVTFEEDTVLFSIDGVDYKERISRDPFKDADMSDVFMKYNHNDSIMVVARTKNSTLKLEVRDDGLYVRISLANTTAGRDLYELVKRGDIDKMSFAFSIAKESYEELAHKWTVERIKKLYDVSAVEVPAYESTSLFARRHEDVEALRAREVEASAKTKKARALSIRLKIIESNSI